MKYSACAECEMFFVYLKLYMKIFFSEIFCLAAKCEIISLRKLWNISLRSMWNEICPHSRQRIFHSVAISLARRANFTEKSQVEIRLGFFLVMLLQNRSLCLIFSKSIHSFQSADRLIPWQWWELHLTAIFRGATPCLWTNLCIYCVSTARSPLKHIYMI